MAYIDKKYCQEQQGGNFVMILNKSHDTSYTLLNVYADDLVHPKMLKGVKFRSVVFFGFKSKKNMKVWKPSFMTFVFETKFRES